MMSEKLPHARNSAADSHPQSEGTVVFPGFSGRRGMGRSGVRSETHLFYINANEMPWLLRLVPPSSIRRTSRASAIYRSRCANCHRADRKGAPPEYPALDNGWPGEAIANHDCADERKRADAGLRFSRGAGDHGLVGLPAGPGRSGGGGGERVETCRRVEVHDGRLQEVPGSRWLSGVTPPWGTLSAINLDTGEYAWKTPLGEFPGWWRKA